MCLGFSFQQLLDSAISQVLAAETGSIIQVPSNSMMVCLMHAELYINICRYWFQCSKTIQGGSEDFTYKIKSFTHPFIVRKCFISVSFLAYFYKTYLHAAANKNKTSIAHVYTILASVKTPKWSELIRST